MEYFEFEKKVSNKLNDESISFDVNNFLVDIERRKKNKLLLYFYRGVGIMILIALPTFYVFNKPRVP